MQDIQARQYYSMAPMWDRIDPLAEKYYGISPYAYCGGDPVNFGDYDGRELQFLGDSASVLAAINEIQSIVGSEYQVSVSEEGIISISDVDKITTTAGKRLAEIIKDSNRTTIKVKQNESTVFIGEAASAKIDMTDISLLGEGGSVNSHSAFMHEINEQYQMQSLGKSVGKAHNDSRQLELNMQNKLGISFFNSELTPNGWYSFGIVDGNYIRQTDILHMNGTIFYVKKSNKRIKNEKPVFVFYILCNTILFYFQSRDF